MLNIVIYANCQARGVEVILKMYLDSMGVASTFHVFENYVTLAGEAELDMAVIQTADVFIYQPINDKYGEKSTAHLLKLLPAHCKTIAFPYVYNDALWTVVHDGVDFRGRQAIDELRAQGKSITEVLNLFESGGIDFRQRERFVHSILALKEREAQCDVVVSNFLVDHVSKQKLFLTQNHPTTAVFVHLVNQMIRLLGYDGAVSADGLPLNLAKLPGEWFHTQYDCDSFGFEFSVVGSHTFYLTNIVKIYYDMCQDARWVYVRVQRDGEFVYEQRMIA